MTPRLPDWSRAVAVFLFLLPTLPVSAQSDRSLVGSWEGGASVQAVAMEGVPIATGVGVHATWVGPSSWGVRLGFRRDVVVQRDLREAYRTSLEWADQRRTSVTPAIVWQPTDPQGSIGQSFQLSFGPTLQVQRGEQVRRIGGVYGEFTLTELLNNPGFDADNTYLDQTRTGPLLLLTRDTNGMNIGATLGLQYGVTYKAVTVRGALMGRKVTNIDGVTFGLGGSVSVSL